MRTSASRYEIAVCAALAVATMTTIGALLHAVFNMTIVA